MLTAKEIIKKEDLYRKAMKHGPEYISQYIKDKHPDMVGEIAVELIMMRINYEERRADNTISDHEKMVVEARRAVITVDAHVKAFKIGGNRSPIVNDFSSYGIENSDKLVAEDRKLGLDLYNACASYVRMYTEHGK